MKILVIDNYDSFTYNLVQYIREIRTATIEVFRNDAITLKEVEAYDTIVLSPGPGVPMNAGITPEIIKTFYKSKNILGVCLGHQAIGEVFGGMLENLKEVYHGIATPINILKNDILFKGLSNPLEVGRYHSWIVKKEGLPVCLEITAEDTDGIIMAFRHKEYPVCGVQFHPESILTPEGKKLLLNFFEYAHQFQNQIKV